MTLAALGRLLRRAAWLLTPAVAWAVSFLGGWVGAKVGSTWESPINGVVLLAAGALCGAVVGSLAWVWIMRHVVERWAPSTRTERTGAESGLARGPS